ncbi:peptidase A24 [Corynebacterium sp. HMSC056F09]|uniref:Prepilin peptidase n=1 Tax=Corynebacterium aurimucosum TaxID=169292 RepID=A0A558IV32_9CORY|nr:MULTISPECIES: A24 family peptidase [Corynebacterium]OFK68483.1 peptidase A24 [Corynebacterium sp. HMSC076G08]OFN36151.1 peptidase A24 [Corynebacterium sp. HMSC072A04]OFO18860.1 peptidase A24 [Corynebacterium sp. HMSC056F09]TVU85228.1 prepilin peptidase [Corynebacterium aurimucosum]
MGDVLFLAWGCALIVYDLRFKRLPNYLTLPAAVLSLWWFDPAGLLWPGLYILVALLSRAGSVGGGDLKLALPLGMVTAHAAGVLGVAFAMVGASLSTLLWGFMTQDRKPAHGPGMLIAAALVVLFNPDTA